MTIGKRISKRRKALGITQSALAEATGVSTAFISQIEGDSRKPSYGLMLKITHALQTSLDSILSEGSEAAGEDPAVKIINSVVPFLEMEQKRKVVDYIFQVAGTKHYKEFPIITSPTECAQFIADQFKVNKIPVDIYKIAEGLGVAIIKASIGTYEGILYKNPDHPLIVLDSEMSHSERDKFTIAILIGHLVMQWHIRSTFHRLKNKRSLDHDDRFEIEARQFAGELLLPGSIVKRDFKRITASIEILERFANEEYKCSMTALAHKYHEYYGTRSVYITSSKSTITREYGNLSYKLVDEIKSGSIAYTFITDPPETKETRSGTVNGKLWFEDIPDGMNVHEESMLDPKFGITVTLLHLAKTKAKKANFN